MNLQLRCVYLVNYPLTNLRTYFLPSCLLKQVLEDQGVIETVLLFWTHS